jgi:hypothetical protein
VIITNERFINTSMQHGWIGLEDYPRQKMDAADFLYSPGNFATMQPS